MRFDVSGADGARGRDGAHGVGYGGDGSPGLPGEHGKSAGNISITLTSPGNDGIQIIGASTGRPAGQIPFHEDIATFATGGHGGRGGDGGYGAAGSPGRDGSDATRYSSGTSGGNGGPGGDGGDGGRGGDGGNGGNIEIFAAEDDMDLFMVCLKGQVRKGSGGAGGTGGAGGPGGPGGRGGSSYSWTTTETYYVNGVANYRTNYHSNPGGSSGCSGRPGRGGNNGRPGNDGNNGTFYETVRFNSGRSQKYEWRYVARVTGVSLIDTTTDDGIVEPGDIYNVVHQIQNTGPMPTPSKQAIFCSIDTNKWVKSPTTVAVVNHLVQENYSTALKGPIVFNVARCQEPAPNTFLCDPTTLVWNVWVERVRRRFNGDETGPPASITVQYPERMSPLHGPATISRAEYAPLVTCTHNISKKPIGKNVGRVLFTECRVVTDPNSMRALNNAGQSALKSSSGKVIPLVHTENPRHNPKTNHFTNSLMQFGDTAELYSRVCVAFSLEIGEVNDFMNPKRIQRMSREIQLAEYYAQVAKSNMLVVTNHRTSKESFDTYNNHSPLMGYRPNFWNATLHDGLSLEQPVGGSCVANDFVHRMILVENNDPEFLTALSTDRNKQREFPMDTISGREITRAMVKGRVGFCIVGEPFDARRKLIPSDLRITPFPDPDSAQSLLERMDDNFWLARFDQLAFRNNLPVSKLTPHKIFSAHLHFEHIFGRSAAWGILWGKAVIDHGDLHRDYDAGIRVLPFYSYDMRLERYLMQRCPEFLDCVLDKYRSTPTMYEKLIPELAPVLGPELEHSNRYRDVYQIIMGELTVAKAHVLLADEAKKCHQEVSAMRPQWKFVVSFELAPHLTEPKVRLSGSTVGGVLLKAVPYRLRRVYLGRLFILRAADRNGAVMQFLPNGAGNITPNDIKSPTMAYGMFKARPFHDKVRTLLTHPQLYHAGQLEAAILSDLLEEQSALRRFNWSYPIADSCLLDHMPRLCSLLAETPTHPALTNVMVRVAIVIERWVYWEDRIMVGRRRRILSAVCGDLIKTWLDYHGGSSTRRRELLAAERKRVAKFSLDTLLQAGTAGTANLRDFSNTEPKCRVASINAMKFINKREEPPRVVTNRWVLETERERLLALHKLRCDFNASGELQKTTRAAQHEALDFITCPAKHSRFVAVKETNTKNCGICRGLPVETASPAAGAHSPPTGNEDDRDEGEGEGDAAAQSPPQAASTPTPPTPAEPLPDPRRCANCSFFVCGACWALGNNPRWQDWR